MESAYGWKILVPGVWWLSMACRLSHACVHTHVRKYEHMHLHNYMHRLSTKHIIIYPTKTRHPWERLTSPKATYCTRLPCLLHKHTQVSYKSRHPSPHSLQNRFCTIPRRQQQCGRRWDGIHAGLQNDVSNKPSNHSCRIGRNSSAGSSRHEDKKLNTWSYSATTKRTTEKAWSLLHTGVFQIQKNTFPIVIGNFEISRLGNLGALSGTPITVLTLNPFGYLIRFIEFPKPCTWTLKEM